MRLQGLILSGAPRREGYRWRHRFDGGQAEADGPLDWQRQLLLDMLPPGETWNGPQPYQPPRPGDADADGEVRPNPATRLMWFVRTALRCREAHLTDAATGGPPAAGAAAAY
jgi:hypothetical protein